MAFLMAFVMLRGAVVVALFMSLLFCALFMCQIYNGVLIVQHICDIFFRGRTFTTWHERTNTRKVSPMEWRPLKNSYGRIR